MPNYTITIECQTAEEARAQLDLLSRNDSSEPVKSDPPSEVVVKTGDVPVDAEGMPFDPNLHSGRDKTNSDGTWRAMRGKKQEEQEARAAFKAQGGNIKSPVVTTPPPTAPVVPGAPVVPTVPEPEPVRDYNITELTTKCQTLIDEGRINGPDITSLYLEVTGAQTPAEAFDKFNVDQNMRNEMMERLQAYS